LHHAVSAGGSTVGSTQAADIVLPAPFLSPVHARITHDSSGWTAAPAAPECLVLLRGEPTDRAPLHPGDVLRLADRVGNFATVRVLRDASKTVMRSALRGTLPIVGQQLVVGSGPGCAIRLYHPLVRPRHAVLRRDQGGVLWLEDRTTVAGTYVNGRRLKGRTRLTPGDTIQIGPSSARVGGDALEPLEQVRGIDVASDRACVDVEIRRKGRHRLLSNVNLHLPPASLTAVAGPSGAGKTTLMRLISGQTAPSAGMICYNGTNLATCREAFATLMGFVPQDDVVHPDLSVVEALSYQARLRLGRDAPLALREERIGRVLGFVGLEQQRHQLVRTLSGGQRKRVSIAAELLNEPQILFLDEPTSGLDPGLDKRMMLLLRLLADQGRTVVLTTHAIAHVDVCDTLVLVGPGGHVIYAGDPDDAPEWFAVPSLGDVFSLIDTAEASAQAAARLEEASRPSANQRSSSNAPGTPPLSIVGASGIAKPAFGSPAWRETVFHQGRIFAERYVRLLTRDRPALAFSLLQGVAVALLTALVAPKPLNWELKGSGPTFVLGCSAVWFGMINAVRELVKERTIWRREELAGANAAAYLASKVSVLGALAAFQSVTTLIALGITLGFPPRSPVGNPFLGMVITLLLANLAGMAMGLVVSALAPSSDRAMSIVPYLLITQLVLCGVLFPLGAVAPVSWLMPARWAVSALGGVAGLSAVDLHQSAGLYPSTAAGMLGNWVALIFLAGSGIAATGRILYRQAANWSVG
ncbi:MAG TPA: ATP-binding cassette domain-containing protein, partial [Acidimicrobiales bacterium]|nr:ATP-binding cassette domain-containing protein [Acidimicrobiales bacterium]